MVVDRDKLRQLEQFVMLAPLHQPRSLTGIRATAMVAPDARQFACFDTVFDRSNPSLFVKPQPA